jgi:aspartyl-tRNA(Asn)/glutamyl-tRNA(Gln) amidotransferase subunit A
MSRAELWRLSIREASDGLVARRFTSQELLESTLQRLHETEPVVHAYATLMEDTARHRALVADEEIRRGAWRGPLHGVPVGIKDLLFTKGVPTQAGSKVLEGFVPECDASVVKRLKDGGAVIVGKTVTHEFAYGRNVPPTRNPWHLGSYPGGSSAGSGVSVAVGSALGAIGTDTAGSIRVPASVEGVVGLKPTYGRVSRRGVIPMSPTLDTVGPLTRTAEDAALMLEVIAGYDRKDSGSIDEPVPRFAADLARGVAGLRLGFDNDLFFDAHVAPDVRTRTEAAIQEIASLGVEIVEVRLPELDHAADVGTAILLTDASEWHQRHLRNDAAKYVPATRRVLELGEMVLGARYVYAHRVRAALRDRLRNSFATHGLDGLVAPTVPITTVPLDQLSVDMTGEGGTSLSTFFHRCFLGNVFGIPAISFPCGFDSRGLPIGLQLYGRPLQEAVLLRVSHAYQEMTDWHTKRPDPTRSDLRSDAIASASVSRSHPALGRGIGQ